MKDYCCQNGRYERCLYCPRDVATFEATFIGGPIGGKTQALARAERVYLVPVMPQHSYSAHINDLGSMPPMPWHSNFPTYEVEEYRLEDKRALSPGHFLLTYRWVNPVGKLRNENAKLRAQNEALGTQAEKLAIIKEALA